MKTLFVSKIQRFSIADGPGIRTTVFLSGCNLRCAWCHNPETWEAKTVTLRFSADREEQSGKCMTVQEVFDVLMRDRAFYEESDGGVTISGGEPLLQADAVAELLSFCRAEGIHTIVDTAASVPYQNVQTVLPYTDLFYYDIKAGDAQTYSELTKGDFALVSDNLVRLIQDGGQAVVRIPLLVGVNADERSRKRIAALALKAGVKEIHLLPYHKYGISKYKALGLPYARADQPLTSALQIERNAAFYRSCGFSVRVEK